MMRTLFFLATVFLVLPGTYAAANCVSEIVIASDTHTLVDRGNGVFTHAVYPSSRFGPWSDIPGAQWVWESDSWSVGNFTFVDTFQLEGCVWDLMTNVTLQYADDDQNYIYMNGEHVTNVGDLYHVWTLDLTPWVREGSNTLVIVVDNWWLWGGLVYKLTITFRDP